MTDEMIAKLKKLAAQEVWIDEPYFDVAELSGRNFDDAYYSGCQSGATRLAREILNSLGVEW